VVNVAVRERCVVCKTEEMCFVFELDLRLLLPSAVAGFKEHSIGFELCFNLIKTVSEAYDML
jgi:hypothetical protein